MGFLTRPVGIADTKDFFIPFGTGSRGENKFNQLNNLGRVNAKSDETLESDGGGANYLAGEQEAAIDLAIAALGTTDALARTRALAYFQYFEKKAAVPKLIKELNKLNKDSVEIVAGLLGVLGKETNEALPALIKALETYTISDTSGTKIKILTVIGDYFSETINQEQLKTIAEYLQEDHKPEIIIAAEHVLEKVGIKAIDYIPRLNHLLIHSENPTVRAVAAYALGKIGRKLNFEVEHDGTLNVEKRDLLSSLFLSLAIALNDKKGNVSESAEGALKEIIPQREARILIELLRKYNLCKEVHGLFRTRYEKLAPSDYRNI